MKLDGLKQLVKEELERALNKVKVKIDYITEDPDEVVHLWTDLLQYKSIKMTLTNIKMI